MYKDGSVRQYESMRCSTTSYNTLVLSVAYSGMAEAHSISELLYLKEDLAKRVVVGEELYLAGAVEKDVVISELLQTRSQPVHVLFKFFQRVQHAAIRT